MKQIKLTNSFKLILIDDEDFDKVRFCKWMIKGGIRGYTIRRTIDGIALTNFILDYTGNLTIDHIDRDIFNNQKSNLREANLGQQGQNKKVYANNTSGYKGVSFIKRTNKYSAHIRINKKLKHLGYFNTAEEAAIIYNKMAIRVYGEYAFQNIIL
jgi:hypothetical protein